jgi:hypothetical protein
MEKEEIIEFKNVKLLTYKDINLLCYDPNLSKAKEIFFSYLFSNLKEMIDENKSGEDIKNDLKKRRIIY